MLSLNKIDHILTSVRVFFQMMNKDYKRTLESEMSDTLDKVDTIVDAISYSLKQNDRYSSEEIQSMHELEKTISVIRGSLCTLIDAFKLSSTINHSLAVFATQTVAQCKEIICAVNLSTD